MDAVIDLHIHGTCAELILCNSEKRNALNTAMWRAIPELIARANAAKAVRTILLHGGTGGVFAAGADISEFAEAYSDTARIRDSGGLIAAALNAIEASAKPVIAAIDGPCYGAGVSLAVAADVRIASDTASFCIPPARLGLIYPAGDTRRLLTLIGPGATKRLLLTAQTIDAREALRIGLVEQLTGDSAIPIARKMAARIETLSPQALRSIKTLIAGLQSGWTDTSPQADALFVEGFLSDDHREGRAAFLEKRQAKFTP